MIGSYFLNKIKNESKKILTEEVHVEGANFLGTANGYDVFEITTWAAATQFVREGTEYNAGECWIHSEANFNQYIVDPVKFFVVTLENTNRVVLGCLRGVVSDNLTIEPFNTVIKLDNFSIESGTENARKAIPADLTSIVPLYLFTDFAYEGENGLGIHEGTITGSYAGLEQTIPAQLTIPENVTTIKANAFTNYPAQEVIIETNVTTMESNAFRDFAGTINVAFESLEAAGWPADWTNSEHVVWGCHLTPEEREQRAREAEERARQAEAERARQEAERIEAERQAAERAHQNMINSIRFREEGKGITILGAKRGFNEIEIPEEFNGKPVLKVAPFAFYDNTNVTKIVLPNTVKEIGKAAFAGCSNLTLTYPKTATLYTDALTGVRRRNAI